ncbi:DUF1499 domain-containing protein [Halomonas sp. XH26]|uniref:DUF1499 domain-containing protein n=1 Tax=Halomonadaceae TaxID=28256 RepID=UPI000EA395D1|nr:MULTISPECIES: DUF1499 domain-containing protein [Halomonas]AYF34375.1 DUF1499 domain-containing protein [Halomonas alkaliphila]MCD6004556.1 DUF1499 domain-containing protein [Halomonas sp. IOP_6]MCD6439349.1 DUF1499 domain-containing protein [Halomonas sp.]UTA78855.1 DUF1499 domain-containing protein [Halomonas sp. XH26]
MAKERSARSRRGGVWPTLLAWLSVIALIASALLMAGAGPAYRWELISLGDAFSLMRNGVYAATAAVAISILLLLISAFTRRMGAGVAAIFVIVATAALLYLPWQQWQRAQQAPAIHDITTDTQNPPDFVALRDAREAAPNAVDYPGEATARQQQMAYPNVQPLQVTAPKATVLAAAQAEVEASGWQIAAITESTIEATATTRWFGFEDDVIIRLTEQQNDVQVDMRSASRLGTSDVGTNALRIETFLDNLGKRLE